MDSNDLKKVCVFTGTRAEYSRLRPVMKEIQESDSLELSVIVSGTHLLEKYGNTVDLIEQDGFEVDEKLYTLVDGENLVTMAKSTGLTISEMARTLHKLNPEYLVIHGDRFEALAAAVAGAMLNIKLAHIQGGEISGSIDESLRHAITKLSHLHFVSNQDAQDRLIKMGEDEKHVYNVGCPMVDTLLTDLFIPKENLLKCDNLHNKTSKINYDPEEPYLLVMVHPVTTEYENSTAFATSVLEAVKKTSIQTIWLWPNADGGAQDIVRVLRAYDNTQSAPRNIEFSKNFPNNIFNNLLRNADCLVGNSSVGIREACYWGTPVVNIGQRQDGRMRGRCVVDVPPEAEEIYSAIMRQLNHGRYGIEHIYGDGNSSKKIVEILNRVTLQTAQKKITY